MKLFENVADLQNSGYLFRITDNGGRTADRFTITFCDGTYLGSSCDPFHPQGFGQHGEGIDVAGMQERVEDGRERDLRFIDLPERVQQCVMQSANGFEDWLASFTPPANRADAVDPGTAYRLEERIGEGLYGVPGAYRIRRETYPDDGTGSEDLGPYDTLKEAILQTLPQDYDLSGPEYHTTVDLWDTEGGPAALWDYEDQTVKAVEIEWETDGESVDLPTEVELPSDLDEDDVADYLSDKFGWLVKGFEIEREGA